MLKGIIGEIKGILSKVKQKWLLLAFVQYRENNRILQELKGIFQLIRTRFDRKVYNHEKMYGKGI